MQGSGIAKQSQIDWGELMQFKRSFTDNPPKMLEKNLSKNGVATHYGTARFTDANMLQAGDETFVGKNIVIATGAKPMPLGIVGEELLATSTDFLEMETLPERIVFIGGGYIAFEFAHIAARAGARVTLLEMMPSSLPAFDPDLVDPLIDATREVGIDIQFETRVSQVVKEANRTFSVKAASPNGEQSFIADLVVHGAGRVPAVEGLQLEKANVEYTRRGIVVNEYLQSVSNPAVYAAGDVAATNGILLTPVAVTEGIVVAKTF